MSTRYLKYTCTNTEPLSIVDLYSSKSDEAAALPYITGASVRGAIMNALAQTPDPSSGSLLEKFKSAFFDGTLRFFNAYPALAEPEETDSVLDTIPVPKGFYENRQGSGEVHHVFSGHDLKGMKRAKAGKMAVFKDNKLLFMTPDMGETFKIRLARNQITASRNKNARKEQQLFRGNYLDKGHIFSGYVAFDESCSSELEKAVKDALSAPGLKLGSSRTAGYGTVKLTETPSFISERVPFSALSTADAPGDASVFDMLCLSGLCMLNEYGEPCGINKEDLAAALGCEKVEIEKASSSVTHICTFNRITGGRSPEYPVYEAGSIFRIRCSQPPSAEALKNIEEKGLGILTREGLGRVLFIQETDSVNLKVKCKPAHFTPVQNIQVPREDLEAMRQVCARTILQKRMEQAMTSYVLNHPFDKGSASKSQRGSINTLCKSLHYTPEKAPETFRSYFEHIEQKEKTNRTHRTQAGSQMKLKNSVMTILETDLFTLLELAQDSICGLQPGELLDSHTQFSCKLELIEEMIHYANRNERRADSLR